jgi:hypothetical protein
VEGQKPLITPPHTNSTSLRVDLDAKENGRLAAEVKREGRDLFFRERLGHQTIN